MFATLSLVTVESFAKMVDELCQKRPEDRNPCHLVIVNSITAYFLGYPGTSYHASKALELQLLKQIDQYYQVAQANISRLPWLMTSNDLVTLQALVLGVRGSSDGR